MGNSVPGESVHQRLGDSSRIHRGLLQAACPVQSSLQTSGRRRVPNCGIICITFQTRLSSSMERIKEDKPITIRDDKGNTSKCIADIVSLFITTMDKLRLEIRANDELQPDLRDLSDTMARLSLIPDGFEGKEKVSQWLRTLSSMQASDELSESQVRQLLFDLETSYNSFNRLLHH